MKRMILSAMMVAAVAVQTVSGHDPRTLAKDFSHTLTIEGAGKLTLSYKSLHWNEAGYKLAKGNETQRARLLASLWKKIGTLDTQFDIVIAGVTVPKGTYNLGIWFDANDNFKLLLAGEKELSIPLQTVADGPDVTFLTFDLRPTNDTDTFIFEGRSGKLHCTAEVKVPYLAPHEHPAADTKH